MVARRVALSLLSFALLIGCSTTPPSNASRSPALRATASTMRAQAEIPAPTAVEPSTSTAPAESPPESAPAPPDTPAAEPPRTAAATTAAQRERMDHHMKHVALLIQHFERVLHESCPRFASAAEWQAYLDGEVDRAVSLAAHAKEATAAARRTGNEELVRKAKLPRRTDDAYALAAKFQSCARVNGASLDLMALANRVEREVPRRRMEIRVPVN